MPFKHQTRSYRTRKGVRYVCEGDVLDEGLGPLKVQAQNLCSHVKAAGRQAFYEKQPGGWYRVFAEVQPRNDTDKSA